jgi:hypothetical protein
MKNIMNIIINMVRSESVILDPIPKSSLSRHDQRLEEILKSGPIAEIQQRKTFKDKAVGFCGSRIGLAIIAGIIFFVLLLFLQPTYIFKKNDDNKRSLKYINYGLVLVLSIIGSVCVFFIPYFITRN